jgi:hypothetical protein
MGTVIARRIASTPIRTAAQTWEKIITLLAPDPDSAARRELVHAAGVACAAISSEATKDAAIVVWGGGPRVRVYCAFDEKALAGEGVNEDGLPTSPTTGDWMMSIPCLLEDVAWSKDKLANVSGRIFARAVDDEVHEDGGAPANTTKSAAINVGEFLKP